MTGRELRAARTKANLTQEEAASRLSLTQAYLSMVESGRRPVSSKLAARAMKVFDLPPTALPLEHQDTGPMGDEQFKSSLGALGYPGFGYLRCRKKRNPAQLLFSALDNPDLDSRVVEALPWLVYTYADLDWGWLVQNTKLNDRQNRLGYVVSLAGEMAKKAGDADRVKRLTERRAQLDRSRLVLEDTLCHDSMTQAERKWLRQYRPEEAKHWNLLTDLEVRHLAYAAA